MLASGHSRGRGKGARARGGFGGGAGNSHGGDSKNSQVHMSKKSVKRPGYKANKAHGKKQQIKPRGKSESKKHSKKLSKKRALQTYRTKSKKGRGAKRGAQSRLTPAQKGMAEVFSRYKLPKTFPEKVLQAATLVAVDTPHEPADALRRDKRDVLCVTIDPADAKDFDDAIFARKNEDGTYFLSVNIADVSHYVQPGSTLDKEAKKRTCSVYLADQVIPMLPFELSDDICSLVPGQLRHAMTVEMELSPEAEVVHVDIFPSLIQSKARFSYETVQAFLDDPHQDELLSDALESPKVLGDSLLAAHEIAEKRRKRRAAKGSLEFVSQEMKFVFDKRGVPVKLQKKMATPATQLVEEAMLLANESVAQMLAARDLKTAYRVHEAPKKENLEDAVPLLREFGLLSSAQEAEVLAANPHALEGVLERARNTPYQTLVSALLLRAQKKALYKPDNEGHYALQAPAYLHFTSPIRRYPDVLVHRSVKALLSHTMTDKHYMQMVNNLGELCNVCSEGEKNAVEAERASDSIKMAEFYLPRIGNIEEGRVAGVEEFGLFVELDETGAQGLLPVQELSRGAARDSARKSVREAEEWFSYDPQHLCLVGETTNTTYEIGQKMKVRIAEVVVKKGFINLALPGRSSCVPSSGRSSAAASPSASAYGRSSASTSAGSSRHRKNKKSNKG